MAQAPIYVDQDLAAGGSARYEYVSGGNEFISLIVMESDGDAVHVDPRIARESEGGEISLVRAARDDDDPLADENYPVRLGVSPIRLFVFRELRDNDRLVFRVSNTDATNPHTVRIQAAAAQTIEVALGNRGL